MIQLDTDKENQTPPFSNDKESCDKCIHQSVCSARKAMLSVVEQFKTEYAYIKPEYYEKLDLASDCDFYTTMTDVLINDKLKEKEV